MAILGSVQCFVLLSIIQNNPVIAILCEKSANQLVKKECEMSKKTRKEFSTQRQLFDKLGTQLKHKRNYINDKQKELQELSRNKVQLQKTTGDELSKLTQQLERYEQKAKAIEKELQDSHEEQLRLLDQIGETEHQLKNTKDRMEQCKESLEKQIKDLEWEEDAKLRNRNLGGSERKPYTAEDYKKIAAAATAVGLGAAGATALFATTATGFVAGSAVGMYGIVHNHTFCPVPCRTCVTVCLSSDCSHLEKGPGIKGRVG